MRKILLLGTLFCAMNVSAFTFVTLAPGTTTSIETEFLAATTTQFDAVLTPNPLASNTYAILLKGRNPNYDQFAPTRQQLFDAVLNVDSYTYVYGWADGMTYTESYETRIAANYVGLCNDPSQFNNGYASTSTWDANTCLDAISTIMINFYNQGVAPPQPVPNFP